MKKSLSLIVLMLIFTACMAHVETAEEWLKKGDEAIKAKNYDEAIKCYKQAIVIDPDKAAVHYYLGFAYDEKKMLDEAIAEYEKAIAIDPDYADAHYNLGSAYLSKGFKDLASDHLYKANLLYLKQVTGGLY